MIDTDALKGAYRTLLDAAATVAESDSASKAPSPGEWNADQILAHVAIVNATTIAAAASVAAGVNPSYDNRIAQDAWTIDQVIGRAGGSAGLRERIRLQGDALCALSGTALSETELDTPVPTLLLSNGAVLVDQVLPLQALISGLAESELPGHTEQLLALMLRGA